MATPRSFTACYATFFEFVARAQRVSEQGPHTSGGVGCLARAQASSAIAALIDAAISGGAYGLSGHICVPLPIDENEYNTTRLGSAIRPPMIGAALYADIAGI